jgi:hypothetical protein
MQPIEPEISVEVFISYAHADQELRKKLEEHLSSLKYSGEILVWQDQEIPAGANWEDQINANLNKADLILLLISASFIASKYCWNKEVQTALQRHKAGTAQVIPIILKPTFWQNTPLGQLQALPTGAKPVTQWSDPDAALEDVVQGIQKVVKGLRIRLQAEVQRKREIGRLTGKIADLYRSFTLVKDDKDDINSDIRQQEGKRIDLEKQLQLVDELIKELKVKRGIAEDEQSQWEVLLKTTSEQLVNLGGELDPLVTLALAPPFSLWGGPSFQKEASNLDFAKGIQSWCLTGDTPQDYIYGIDPTLRLNGKACAYLKSRVDPAVGFGTLAQAFQGSEYRGKRLRLSGWIKAQEVEQWAGLWMRVDGNEGSLRFDNMHRRAIQGNCDMKQYEVILDVLTESVGIYFGILLVGKGQIWLSNVRFEVVGRDVPTTNRL